MTYRRLQRPTHGPSTRRKLFMKETEGADGFKKGVEKKGRVMSQKGDFKRAPAQGL